MGLVSQGVSSGTSLFTQGYYQGDFEQSIWSKCDLFNENNTCSIGVGDGNVGMVHQPQSLKIYNRELM